MSIGLSLLDLGNECWIKLVGLRESVGLRLLDLEKTMYIHPCAEEVET